MIVVGGLILVCDFEFCVEFENDCFKFIKVEEELLIVFGWYIVEFIFVSDSYGYILVCKLRLIDG